MYLVNKDYVKTRTSFIQHTKWDEMATLLKCSHKMSDFDPATSPMFHCYYSSFFFMLLRNTKIFLFGKVTNNPHRLVVQLFTDQSFCSLFQFTL